MIDKEMNNKLYQEYSNKKYEELDKIEKENNLTETEMIILAVAKIEKELAMGKVDGIPAEKGSPEKGRGTIRKVWPEGRPGCQDRGYHCGYAAESGNSEDALP